MRGNSIGICEGIRICYFEYARYPKSWCECTLRTGGQRLF